MLGSRVLIKHQFKVSNLWRGLVSLVKVMAQGYFVALIRK